MSSMFSYCPSLKELNVSNFKTSNMTNMKDMFIGYSEKLINKIKHKLKTLKIRIIN